MYSIQDLWTAANRNLRIPYVWGYITSSERAGDTEGLGSLCSGLLAFAHAGNGAMVKRLHLGRAAESGILAARLAESGFEGPDTILDGASGFLEAYCEESDPALLNAGVGTRWETQPLGQTTAAATQD